MGVEGDLRPSRVSVSGSSLTLLRKPVYCLPRATLGHAARRPGCGSPHLVSPAVRPCRMPGTDAIRVETVSPACIRSRRCAVNQGALRRGSIRSRLRLQPHPSRRPLTPEPGGCQGVADGSERSALMQHAQPDPSRRRLYPPRTRRQGYSAALRIPQSGTGYAEETPSSCLPGRVG